MAEKKTQTVKPSRFWVHSLRENAVNVSLNVARKRQATEKTLVN
ncbi:hypothetical protein [Sporomusa aerivorans]